jgi:hypothetical protein
MAVRHFIESTHLKQTDMEQLATGYATELRAQLAGRSSALEECQLIIHLLGRNTLLHQLEELPHTAFSMPIIGIYLFQDTTTKEEVRLTAQDIEPAFRRLRSAIIEQLRSSLNTETYHFVTHCINDRLFAAADDIVVRPPFQLLQGVELKASHAAAQTKLYQAQERSPHIAYTLLHMDRSTGWELHRAVDIVPLSLSNLPLPEIVRTVTDAVRGCLFLWENDLVISDLTPDNIQARHNGQPGQLFDLDTLCLREKTFQRYPARTSYIPPECQYNRNNKSFSMSPATMVYELGLCLSDAMLGIQPLPFQLPRLIRQMRSPVPGQRPSLPDCITSLEAVI